MSGDPMHRNRISLPILLALIVSCLLPARSHAAVKDFLYLYDAGQPAQVFGFKADTTTGGLTPIPGSPFKTNDRNGECGGGACEAAAYSFENHLLFTAGSRGVSVFKVLKSGKLSLVPGSPFGGRDG